jgi:hypothetical protein
VCDICISFGWVYALRFPECLEWVQSRSITSFLGLWNFESNKSSNQNLFLILTGQIPQKSRNVDKAICAGCHVDGKVGIPLPSLAHRDCHFGIGESVSMYPVLYHMKITLVLISWGVVRSRPLIRYRSQDI